MGSVTANANPPTPGSKYRIKVGQTIAGFVWSSTAFTVSGFWTIIYDDGSPDFWPVSQSASGSSRASVLWTTGQIAKKNGWVVGGQVGSPSLPAQRGQAYFMCNVIDANLNLTSDTIANGYGYAGHPVQFGQYAEPGPGGGHGFTVNTGLAQPAAGADYAGIVTPSGAMRRIRAFFGQLVTGAGVANREFAIQHFAITIRGGVVAGEIQTASLTVDYVGGGGGISSSGVTSNLAGGVTMIGFGDFVLYGGTTDIAFKTYNIQAADQWGAGNLTYEEWVMPN